MWLDEFGDDTIDASSRVPLHTQLSSALRSRITDGTLTAGSPFPTENELQHRFGISRSVVRQALLTLSSEGLLQRSRGRGSVIAPRGTHHRLVQRISGLSTQLPGVTTTVLSLARDDDPAARMALDTSEVLGLRRLRSAGGEPIAIIETWLPYAIANSLTVDELTDASLHTTLRRKYDITLVAGRRQVRGVAASAHLAGPLGVETGAPLLLLEGTSVDSAGTPIEMFRTWHRADRVVFDIDVLPGSDARTAAFTGDPGAEDRRDRPGSLPPVPRSARAGLSTRARELAGELTALSDELDSLP